MLGYNKRFCPGKPPATASYAQHTARTRPLVMLENLYTTQASILDRGNPSEAAQEAYPFLPSLPFLTCTNAMHGSPGVSHSPHPGSSLRPSVRLPPRESLGTRGPHLARIHIPPPMTSLSLTA
jgi:hypothetical protein